MAVAKILRFPNPVNDVAARLVAAGACAMALAVVLGVRWMIIPLALGFVLRVLAGPRWSPLALVVTRIVVPRLSVAPRYVPGPPKRFAQGIGATLSVGALLATYAFGAPVVGQVFAAMIVGAAFLEAAFGYCLGCKAFALLMRARVIPQSVCLECADISGRLAAAEARHVA